MGHLAVFSAFFTGVIVIKIKLQHSYGESVCHVGSVIAGRSQWAMFL